MGLKQAVPAESLVAAKIFNSHCLGRRWCMYPTSVQKNPLSKAIEPNLLDEVRNEAFHEAY
jgi:hypothetical protein